MKVWCSPRTGERAYGGRVRTHALGAASPVVSEPAELYTKMKCYVGHGSIKHVEVIKSKINNS